MTRKSIATLMAALALLQAGAALAGEARPAGAGADAGSTGASSATPDVAARGPALPGLPRFVPPDRASPGSRLGGATRGAGDSLPNVEALVPAETGLTLEPQPVLYWYLSRPSDVRVDLRLLSLEPSEIVLERTLPPARAAGIQRIRLADHGVELTPGRAYQWLVLLVPNPGDRSYDRVVGGGIERIEPDAALRARLAGADRDHRPYVLAESGVWYDAIDILSQEIEARPGDPELWNRRAALFEQVGLPEVPIGGSDAPAFEPKPRSPD